MFNSNEYNNFYKVYKEKTENGEMEYLVYYDKGLSKYVKIFNVTLHQAPMDAIVKETDPVLEPYQTVKKRITTFEKINLNRFYKLELDPAIASSISEILTHVKVFSIYQENAKEGIALSNRIQELKFRKAELEPIVPWWTKQKISKDLSGQTQELAHIPKEIKELNQQIKILTNVYSMIGVKNKDNDCMYSLDGIYQSTPLYNEKNYVEGEAYAVEKSDLQLFYLDGATIQHCMKQWYQMKESEYYGKKILVSKNIDETLEKELKKHFYIQTICENQIGRPGNMIRKEIHYQDGEYQYRILDITDIEHPVCPRIENFANIPVRGTLHTTTELDLEILPLYIQEELPRLLNMFQQDGFKEKIEDMRKHVFEVEMIDFTDKPEFQLLKEKLNQMNHFSYQEYDASFSTNVSKMAFDDLIERNFNGITAYEDSYCSAYEEGIRIWNELKKYQHRILGYQETKMSPVYAMFEDEITAPIGDIDNPFLSDRVGGAVRLFSPCFLTEENINEIYDESKRVKKEIKGKQKKF